MQSKTTRRTFIKGLAATSILGGLGMWRMPVWAVTSPGQAGSTPLARTLSSKLMPS